MERICYSSQNEPTYVEQAKRKDHLICWPGTTECGETRDTVEFTANPQIRASFRSDCSIWTRPEGKHIQYVTHSSDDSMNNRYKNEDL